MSSGMDEAAVLGHVTASGDSAVAGVAVLRLVGRANEVQESGQRRRFGRGPVAFGELVDQAT